MDIRLSAKNFSLTPSVKTFVQERIEPLVRYWSSIIRAHVELSVDRHHRHGEIFAVRVRLEVPGRDVRVSATATDLRAAIDLVCPKIERQILRAKSRRHQKYRLT